jgi:hypothetical protein
MAGESQSDTTQPDERPANRKIWDRKMSASTVGDFSVPDFSVGRPDLIPADLVLIPPREPCSALRRMKRKRSAFSGINGLVYKTVTQHSVLGV